MAIITRPARDEDRQRCVWIEAGAIQGLAYIDDVWTLFTRETVGDLTLAETGGSLGGMGKLTHLFGRYAWLETLRVHPEFQNMGLGKAIYHRFMAEMAQRGLGACGMYTGLQNTRSRHLAELYGLALAGRFTEYTRPAEPPAAAPAFEPVAEAEGEGLLAPLYPLMGGFLTVSRTWYPAAPGLGRHLAGQGWLWQGGDGTLLVAGARFQPRRALHIPFIHGDAAAALSFAHALAGRRQSAALSAVRPYGHGEQGELLRQNGFAQAPEDHIILWKDL